MFAFILSQNKDFKSLVKKLIIFIGIFIVGLGFIQFLFYQSLRNLFYLGWDEHLYRMFSIFLDPNFAGAFFVLYYFLFVLNILIDSLKINKIFFIFHWSYFTFYLDCNFLTYSRSALNAYNQVICFFIPKYKNILQF